MEFKNSKFVWVLGFIFLTFTILGLLFFIFRWIGGEEGVQYVKEVWFSFKTFLLNHGFWLFLSIAILPGLILPCAPLLILAGIWGSEFGILMACIYSILALTMNLIWTYWFSYGPGHSLISKLLKRSKYRIPKLPSKNLLQWALILRLTPGIPFIFTNYALGLLKMPFIKYLIVSVPIIAITDCGFILATAGIFGGGWKYLWGGVSILIIMILLGRILSERKKHAN